MSTDYKYEQLPTSDEKRRISREEPTSDVRELHRRLQQDPRFNPPTPSPWKRIALVVFMLVLFWLGLRMRLNAIEQATDPKVVHAQRYSNDFKFRPAASPVITEKMQDGRTRLRGAVPTIG